MHWIFLDFLIFLLKNGRHWKWEINLNFAALFPTNRGKEKIGPNMAPHFPNSLTKANIPTEKVWKFKVNGKRTSNSFIIKSILQVLCCLSHANFRLCGVDILFQRGISSQFFYKSKAKIQFFFSFFLYFAWKFLKKT